MEREPAVDSDDPARFEGERSLFFAGLEWGVKDSGPDPCGPGPNRFSSDPRNVWVDKRGRLHLRITARDGTWQCAEILAREPMGTGTYTFHLEASPVLDRNAVLGFFLYADDHNEIDIELSTFGGAMLPNNAQFIVQPLVVNAPFYVTRFWLDPAWVRTRHRITWEADRVAFRSSWAIDHDATNPGRVIAEGSTAVHVPAAMHLRPRMNLWLVQGQPPSDGRQIDVIVSNFSFDRPLAQQDDGQP